MVRTLLVAVVIAGCARPAKSAPEARSSALVEAVRSDATADITAVIQAGLSADTMAPDGTRPLTEAARHDRIAAAQLLLDNEARLDLADSAGLRPIDYAVEYGHRRMTALLIKAAARQAGASAEALAWFDAADGHGAARDWHQVLDGELVSLGLSYALLNDRNDLVMALRRGAGIPNRSGYAPLTLAARFGKAVAVAAILGASANPAPESGSHLHETPLMDAARDGFAAIGKALIKAGARVDDVDAAGQTALMWAVREGETEYAEMLLGAGADPARRDLHGDTALDIARRINHSDLVTLLEAHAKRDHQAGLTR